MKFFKVLKKQYIIASSFAEAESLWKREPDRYEIQHIELISSDVIMAND